MIALDNRGHGESTKLYDPADYHTDRMADDVRALIDHLGSAAPTSWAIRWARGSPRSWRSRIRSGCARVVLGGLGMHLVDGVGLPESIAEALEAPSLADVTDPQGRTFRAFAEQTKSDRRALAACIRGSRQVLTREQAAAIEVPVLIAVGTKDAIAGSAESSGGAHAAARGRCHSQPRSHARGRRQGVQGGRAGIPQGASMTRHITPAAAMFKGARGNTLVGDVYGEEGPPVLLLHGGGQTRHAWSKTGDLIAQLGRVAYAVDQRGHGDSEWVADGAYSFPGFRRRRAGAGRHAGRAQRRAAGRGRRFARRHRLDAGRRRAATAGERPGVLGAGAGRHHAAGRSRRRRQGAGLHARARQGGLRHDRGGRRRGRRLSAAPAAAALATKG